MTRGRLSTRAIRMAPADRQHAPSGRWVTFVDGPFDGQRRESDVQPDTLPAAGGLYLRSVRCADDGDLRYVFREAGPTGARPTRARVVSKAVP